MVSAYGQPMYNAMTWELVKPHIGKVIEIVGSDDVYSKGKLNCLYLTHNGEEFVEGVEINIDGMHIKTSFGHIKQWRIFMEEKWFRSE